MTDRVNSVVMDNLKSLKRHADTIDRATAARDAGIVEARVDGFPWEKIATAAGVTRQGAEKIAKRFNNDVLPRPRQSA